MCVFLLLNGNKPAIGFLRRKDRHRARAWESTKLRLTAVDFHLATNDDAVGRGPQACEPDMRPSSSFRHFEQAL
jgi:hypothetical protein